MPEAPPYGAEMGENITAEGRTSAKPAAWRQTFSSLANRDYRNLWLGMLLMMGAMQMLMLAQSYLIYDLTGSPSLLGLINSSFAIPLLILGLFAGATADRLEGKQIILIGQSGATLSSLAIAVIIATGTVTWVHLLVGSMVLGACMSFLMPARQAIIPQIVGEENLTNAMALNAAGMSATTLLAPALAGALYAAWGPAFTFFVISALFFVSVLLTGLLPKLKVAAGRAKSSMAGDIGAGLSYVRRSPLVLVLMVTGLATALFAMPFRMLMPIFVVEIYDRGPDAMGLMVSGLGLGSLAGALFIAAAGAWKRGLMLIAGIFVTGIGLILVALVPFYAVALGLMVLMGLGDGARMTLNQALIIEVADPPFRGRVMSIFMMNFALMPLAVLPAGVAAEFLGAQIVIAVLAALLLASGMVILFTQQRLREIR